MPLYANERRFRRRRRRSYYGGEGSSVDSNATATEFDYSAAEEEPVEEAAVENLEAVAPPQDTQTLDEVLHDVSLLVHGFFRIYNKLERWLPPNLRGIVSLLDDYDRAAWMSFYRSIGPTSPQPLRNKKRNVKILMKIVKKFLALKEAYYRLRRRLQPLRLVDWSTEDADNELRDALGFGRFVGGSTGTGEDHALSDGEIRKLLPGIRIVSYPELKRFRTIEDALDREGRVVILFLTRDRRTGHWISVHTTPDGGLESFCSYGMQPDGQGRWLSKSQRIALHEDVPVLSGLLRAAKDRGVPITYNHHRFQSSKSGIATCGRHVVVRLLNRHLTLPQYKSFIASAGGTPDEAVTRITNSLLHNASN